MELKTLKDLNLFISGNKTEKTLGNRSIKGELKQTAIQWIKEIDGKQYTDFNFTLVPGRIYNVPELDTDHWADGYVMSQGIIHWIKYFFNITEEDLK